MERSAGHGTSSSAAGTPSSQTRHHARRLLVGVDFSEASRLALEASVRLAARDHTQVDVLHVYWGPWHQLHYRAPSPDGSPRAQQEYRDKLQARLDEFVEPVRALATDIAIATRLKEAQHVHYGLVTQANEIEADLVVIGKPQEHAWRRILGTDTAWRVMREAECPVLVCAGADTHSREQRH